HVCETCFGPLEVVYDYAAVRRVLTHQLIASRPRNLWRYRELLPIEGEPQAGLHSGFTPLVRADRLGAALGVRELWVKDDSVNRLCSEIADKYGWAFVNINMRPYYTEGAKTYGFEIAEQLGWRLPRHVVVPTAGGTILPKVAKAFHELLDLVLDDGDFKIYTAQAAGCAPVVQALHRGTELIAPVKPATIAKSIAIGNPADGFYVLKAVRESGGWGEAVTDEEIVEGIRLLARTEGIFTEPAGGTTVAVTKKLIEQGRIPRDESIVVCITGNGYKTLEAVLDSVA